jgi:prophage antirepressor-like protein
MTALEVFTYSDQQVRTAVDESGEAWFVAADVCTVLGHSNPTMAVGGLDDDERGLRNVETPSGNQQMVVVSEAGLYSLVIRSRKAEAKAFRRWVTHEVLPAIRKTGTYRALPQTYAEALKELASTVEAREAAEARARELEGPASAWERLASSTGDLSVGQAAKVLDRDPAISVGPRKLFEVLRDQGWVYRDATGHWIAYQYQINRGTLVHKATSHIHPRTGEIVLDPPQIRVTVKGLECLHKTLGGVAPPPESLPQSAPKQIGESA